MYTLFLDIPNHSPFSAANNHSLSEGRNFTCLAGEEASLYDLKNRPPKQIKFLATFLARKKFLMLSLSDSEASN